MKHSRFGLILFLTSGSLLACNGDPTSSIRDDGPKRVIADPNVIFLDKGAATFVTLQLVDAQGNQLPTTFDATSQSALVTVVRDTTFLATTNGADLNTTERFTVTGTEYVSTGISVTAGSDTLTIPVHVVPKTTIAATFSNLAPALGETVTITAPPGVTFSPTSTVNFGANALPPANVVVATDGSSISFVPPPNLTAAPAQITDVVSVGSSDLTFTNTTADGLTTPEVVDLPGTVSSFTPAMNQPVTVTLSGATATPPSDTTAVPVQVGPNPAILLSRTPTTITFLPSPGSVGPVTVAGVFLNALPQFELTLSTPDTMTVGALVPLQGTDTPGGAPPIAAAPPDSGTSSAIFDAGVFTGADITGDGGLGAQYYKFTVSQDAVYHFVTTWPGAAAAPDIDQLVCFDTACADGAFVGAGNTLPEDGTVELTPGTYYLSIVLFDGTAPASFSTVITNDGPPPPP